MIRRIRLALLFLSLAFAAAPTAHADIPELAGNWHLDSNGALSPDTSGHGLDATKVGSPTAVSPARFGNGLKFPTEADYLNAGNHPELQPANVSVLAWVRSATTPIQVKGVVSQGATNTCSHSSYSLYTGGSLDTAGLRFYIWNGSSTPVTPPAPNTMWDGQWHLAAGTYDGSAVRLYVDGQEVGSTLAAGNIAYGLANNEFIIGGAKDASCTEDTSFSGDMDEVRVYNRALSPGEIAYLARSDHTNPPELPIPTTGNPNPPAPPPARNLTAPAIEARQTVNGQRTYACLTGTWSGLAADPGYTYSWWRRNPPSSSGRSTSDTQVQAASSNAVYSLPRADVGKTHYCQVSARGLNGLFTRATSTAQVLAGPAIGALNPDFFLPKPYGNVRVRGIDVFQVSQHNNAAPRFDPNAGSVFSRCSATPTSFYLFLGRCVADGENPARVRYSGVDLDARKRTFAQVYVNMVDNRTPYPDRWLQVTLTGRVGTKTVGIDPWGFTRDPAPSTSRFVPLSQRTDSGYFVRFELDPAWLAEAAKSPSQGLGLDAQVTIWPGLEGFLDQCRGDDAADCLNDDRFQLDRVVVRDDIPVVRVKTVPLLTNKQRTTAPAPSGGLVLNPPDTVLKRGVQLYPGGERLNIFPYGSSINVDTVDKLIKTSPFCRPFADLRDCRGAYIDNQIGTWQSRSSANRTGFDLLMAVMHYHIGPPNNFIEPGWETGGTLRKGRTPPIIRVNDSQDDAGRVFRPITAAAHEFGHAMGAPHADQVASIPVGLPNAGRTCGGGSNGQQGEPWPPDNTGRLEATAFDFGTIRTDTDTNPLYDLMSYCGQEFDAWLSPFNWNRSMNTMRAFNSIPITGRAALRAIGARAGQAFVSGVVGPGGAAIGRVVAADPSNLVPDPDPSSPLQVRALDAGGRQLAVVGAAIERQTELPSVGTFVVGIPSGTTAVELVAAGQVLDRVAKSKPPTVRVLAPSNGARVGGGKRSGLAVRWTASDADKGSELEATVQYAANGHSGWRTVFSGPSTGMATIPGRFLERASGARMRVRINDGFNEVAAQSGRFRAEGTPPRAEIVMPAVRELRAQGRTELVGQAFDDRNQTLRARSLTWFAGKRQLGRGNRLRVRLPVGNVTIKLRARDRFGRVATATRRVKVSPVPLELRTFAAPVHVAKTARSVKVTVATSTAAVLRAGGKRYSVGPRSKRLTIPLPGKPATGILKIKVSVTAKGPRQRVMRNLITVLRA